MTEAAAEIVNSTKQHVQGVRNQFHRERVNGGVSEETHRELATAALQYRDVLAEYSDENAVRERWEESGVDDLERLVGETRTVEVDAPGRTSNTRTAERPAVLATSPVAIYHATKKLDRLAKELGFAAEVADVTPHHDLQETVTVDEDGRITIEK